jgi:hypothetical protein
MHLSLDVCIALYSSSLVVAYLDKDIGRDHCRLFVTALASVTLRYGASIPFSELGPICH